MNAGVPAAHPLVRVETRTAHLPEDLGFLQAVYASTREADLRLLGWSASDPAAHDFVRMQFEAQRRHYARSWPSSDWMVILVDGEPAGRLIIGRSPERVHIVDLSLLPRYRGMGVGGELVGRLLCEADRAALVVTCEVAVGNQAAGFWEHLGFRTRDGGDAYTTMEWACGTSPR